MRLPRLTWHSLGHAPPMPGEYMISMGPKARAAYLIHEVREVKPRTPRKHKVWSLSVERIGRDRIPAGEVAHQVWWFKRGGARRRKQ